MSAALTLCTRVCLGCPEKGPLPWSRFHAGAKWPDGTMRWPQPRCKECDRKRLKAWRAANPDLVAAHKRTGEAKRLEKMASDPEHAAAMRVYWRERMRVTRGTPPERYQVTFAPRGIVNSAVVREKVEKAGVDLSTIARRAGYQTEGAVRHALARPTIQARTAARILHAIGVAPLEVGL